MNLLAVTSATGKIACFVGIATYCYATLHMFIFRLSSEDLSKHPEQFFFSALVSTWGALPFLFLWFVRRRAYPFAAHAVLCLAALTMTTYEIWKLSSALPQAIKSPPAVGEVLIWMPIYLWPVSVCVLAFAEILSRLEAQTK
jgi:hypothetical protein